MHDLLCLLYSGQQLQDSWGRPVARVSSGREELSVEFKVLVGSGEGVRED